MANENAWWNKLTVESSKVGLIYFKFRFITIDRELYFI